jgi:hypothetical protein
MVLVINVVASLCADVCFFGLALRMKPWLLDILFLPGATEPGADWSGALVRPGVAGPWRLIWYSLTQPRWGRGRCTHVMGGL